ncbi:ABC transporter permease [Candidatus Foliamicus sp.]
MGPSGSGKSTLMNILGCLDRPTEGEYYFRGHNTGRLNADGLALVRQRAFGFIFQSYNLIDSATARENVELPAAYARLNRGQSIERARNLLRRFGLGKRLGHRPRTLSGGEQQRVAIARALMNGGSVILADEPTGALDSENTEQVLRALTDLARDGHTVVLITHDPEVAAWAERRIDLLDGRLVADVKTDKASRGKSRGHAQNPGELERSDRARAAMADSIERLRAGLVSLRANLLRGGGMRTALTALGIAVGVWSVVALLSVVQGGYQQTMKTLSQAGANAITILPERRMSNRDPQPAELVIEDVRAIQENAANVRAALPNVSRRYVLRHGAHHQSALVLATEPRILAVRRWTLSQGVFLTQADAAELRQTAVIGADTGDVLFPNANPVGKYILIGETPFLVKGVLSREGGQRNFASKLALIPLSTGQALLFGGESLDSIDVFVEDPRLMDETVRGIEELFSKRHRLGGFELSTNFEMRVGFSETERLFSTLVGSVGAIALFVGGMGVMSIMLLSVSERAREIGIRMAVGARRRDVLRQFLGEAVAITVAGGALGTLLGFASGPALSTFGIPVSLSAWFVFAALGCATITGLVAGLVPAYRAAGLDPVAALTR